MENRKTRPQEKTARSSIVSVCFMRTQEIVGSAERKECTIIGDVVNVVSGAELEAPWSLAPVDESQARKLRSKSSWSARPAISAPIIV